MEPRFSTDENTRRDVPKPQPYNNIINLLRIDQETLTMAGNDDQSLALQLRGLGQSDEAAVGFPSGVDIRHDD